MFFKDFLILQIFSNHLKSVGGILDEAAGQIPLLIAVFACFFKKLLGNQDKQSTGLYIFIKPACELRVD
jgi:hypothetical protein